MKNVLPCRINLILKIKWPEFILNFTLYVGYGNWKDDWATFRHPIEMRINIMASIDGDTLTGLWGTEKKLQRRRRAPSENWPCFRVLSSHLMVIQVLIAGYIIINQLDEIVPFRPDDHSLVVFTVPSESPWWFHVKTLRRHRIVRVEITHLCNEVSHLSSFQRSMSIVDALITLVVRIRDLAGIQQVYKKLWTSLQ